MSKNHANIRTTIRIGDILLSRKIGSPISKAIAGATRSYWSHAFLYIGDGKIIESDWKGVVIRPLEYYLNAEYNVGLFRVIPELTDDELKKVVKHARKMLGIHYGYLQLIWQGLLRLFGKSEDPDWSLDLDSGLMCSEMIAKAYAKMKVEFKALPPHQMEPADLDESMITVRIA